MQLIATSYQSQTLSGDALVLPMLDGKLWNHDFVNNIDQKMGKLISQLITKAKFPHKKGENKLFVTHDKIPFDYVLVYSLGDAKKLTYEQLRIAANQCIKVLRRLNVSKIVSALTLTADNFQAQELGSAICEGSLLGSYEFHPYKSKQERKPLPKQITYLLNKLAPAAFNKGISKGKILCEAVCLSRDLCNTPADDKYPKKLAEIAKKIKGLRTRVFHETELKKMGMNGILSVGRGSQHAPVFVEMIYKPKKSKKVVAIVGKGVTFDSGGLSLKPPKGMEDMKEDMSGAGNTIAIMQAIAALKPNVEVRGYFPSAENMPSGTALKPGDVYKAYNGTTVEVLNTDAEGRLILGDALAYVCERKPDVLIDMATLTGACLVALGELYAGVLGNDKKLMQDIINCGEHYGEKIWELPLAEEYEDEIKSTIADIKNVGGSYGGTINGALFLKQFIKNTKWAHVDIAGPSATKKELGYCPKGCTGFMVRTVVKYILEQE